MASRRLEQEVLPLTRPRSARSRFSRSRLTFRIAAIGLKPSLATPARICREYHYHSCHCCFLRPVPLQRTLLPAEMSFRALASASNNSSGKNIFSKSNLIVTESSSRGNLIFISSNSLPQEMSLTALSLLMIELSSPPFELFFETTSNVCRKTRT